MDLKFLMRRLTTKISQALLVCVLSLLALAMPAKSWAQACHTFTLPSTVSGTYSGSNLTIALPVTVTHNGNNCPFSNGVYVNFEEIGYTGSVGNSSIAGVPYSINHSGSSNLIHPENQSGYYSYSFLGSLGPGGTPLTASFQITLPAGYVATGSSTKTLRIHSYDWSVGRFVARQSFQLRISAPETLELTVAGTTTETGAATSTLDFGSFTGTSDTRSLSIRSKSNIPYVISVESTQGGVLRRTTSCGLAASTTNDPAEQQAYSVNIGGQAVTPAMLGGSIGSNNRFVSSSATTGLANDRRIIPMSVTVPAFNLAERRAGQFCDVIRLRIAAQ